MQHRPDSFTRRSALRLGATAIAMGALLPALVQAQAPAWPTRTVRLVVAAPGGASEQLARLIAPALSEIWRQPVIIEQKPGGGGTVGTEYMMNSTDGHTILVGTQSSLLPKFTRKDLKWDPLVDLVPIYKMVNVQVVIVTNAATAAKYKTLAGVIAHSKSTDKGLFYAGNSPTAVYNLSMSLLNQSFGAKYTSVNYNNIGAMAMALLRDDAQLIAITPSPIQGHIDNGALVPLAAVSRERYANLPNVPTVYEAVNYNGYLPQLWSALFGPKSTPPAVAEKIAKDVFTVLHDPVIRKQVESTVSGAVVDSSPGKFNTEFRTEADVWKNLFQTLNIQPE